MAAVLEDVLTPAIETAEADALFEAESFAAWEEYQLNGQSVGAETIDGMFTGALTTAKSVAKSCGE